ncbi:DHA2 family efflux MFS transporter permease subunit [Bacteriovorax sp. PP10]|uniref:DHA2 family efflux MFS transporter permease subunit n=1 Tax=Bacteriovorax antarcticus TaxID=3088717 RepID=A0ABU5W0B7_9BACT|nr:DHA2 family efflux MFS transporter permease subunit [Bacteriovorax sp. PP10]MEA9357710.1 DHA2 family efflux MFS transporter permease subunit [Bacteriovorax sp. PP10]
MDTMSEPNPKAALIIFVAVMASLLEIIDTSIVNVALPTMMGNLGATLEDISMVITGYAIANAVILPLSAWLGERFGRRNYYLGCIGIFTITSVACGLAPNLEFLIIFRILQGLAGGALLPTSQTLIYEQFPKEKAGIAGAIFGMSVMVGPALGPVMGGYLTDNFGWRSIFNINLPLGLIALFIGMTCIYDSKKEEGQAAQKSGFDTLGLILLVAGIGCLQYALERGETDDWFSSRAITICIITSLISLPSFVWWELKVKNPIVNVRLFKEQIVVNGILLMGLLGFYLYGVLFVLPVFVSRVFNYTATQTGTLFIPGSLVTMALMPLIGKLMVSGVSVKKLIFVGITGLMVCLWTMTALSPLSSKSDILIALYTRGFALAFLFVPINSGILSQFKGRAMGEVSGLLNLSRQIGGSIGIALVGTLLTMRGHQNYVDMAAKVSLLNTNTQQIYYQTEAGISKKMVTGVGMLKADKAALTSLKHRLDGQVFMMSFNQLMWIIMIIFSFAYIPWYFLKLRVKPTGVIDAH